MRRRIWIAALFMTGVFPACTAAPHAQEPHIAPPPSQEATSSPSPEPSPPATPKPVVGGPSPPATPSTVARQADNRSHSPAVSSDGRYVAFASHATNLVPNDTNKIGDVFVRDRVAHTTFRVSISSAGRQSNGESAEPVISADGRYIAYESRATNLTPEHTPGVFLRDTLRHTTTLVSVSSSGRPAAGVDQPAMTPDGRYVAFVALAAGMDAGDPCRLSHPGACADILVRDRLAGTTEKISVAAGGGATNGASLQPSLSADGRHVAFSSHASNLVAGDTNDAGDAFVYDRLHHTTARVSVKSDGSEMDLLQYGGALPVEIAPDGRAVVFGVQPENGNSTYGVGYLYVRDLTAARTVQVAQACLPEQGGLDWDCLPLRASFSADGRYLVFEGRVPLVAGERARCYPFNRAGECPDIYLLDRSTGRISRQSVSNSGAEANGWSRDAVLSADGRFIVFSSTASNLVRGDTNRAQSCADDLANPINCSDIFVREWRAGITSRASVG